MGGRELVVAVAVGSYAWWVAGLAHFTLPALVAVVVPGAVVLAVGWRRREPRPPAPVGSAWTAAWVALIAATLALELVAFRLSPREAHPTLSSIADAALQPRPVAALAFVAWLALGWNLARR